MNYSEYTRFVIILNKIPGQETKRETILRHIEHLKKLGNDGKLILCGPFTDHDAGMVIVNVATKEDAEKIAKADPFVTEGVRTYDLRTWLLACEKNNYLA